MARSSTPAAWDDSYDLENRRVAIIGTGATAVQLIPELAKQAADLTVYQRTPIHVVPKFDVRFPERAKRLFARVPLTQRAIRWVTDPIYEVDDLYRRAALPAALRRRFNISAADLAKMHRFASVRDKELRDEADAGLRLRRASGRRSPTATTASSPNRTCICRPSGIERIEADGIVNKDGSKAVIDTLVLATGFDLWEANFPAIEVIGRKGRNLGKWWRDNRFQAYQGMSMPYFPNFLSLASPYALHRV